MTPHFLPKIHTMTNHQLTTPHLTLLCCTTEMLNNAIESEEKLAQLLNVTIADNWLTFGTGVFSYTLVKLKEDATAAQWWGYFPIHTASHTLIGTCGYKGKPDANGYVEIGYEIAPAFRNKGFATECALALIDFAFQHAEVTCIQAHTLAEDNPSTHVLLKCGFSKVETLSDPEEGDIWKWELFREKIKKS